jgi:tetrapyrrole methylase family protein/MazG family protein
MLNDFEFKDKYAFNDLVNIMTILRGPNGCPWDKEQTHLSIRKNFLEETYEVLDAIDKNDIDNMCEELGDVMLQVAFHSEMERQLGHFDIDDVCNRLCLKLIERHPHIFGDVVAENSDKVLKNWDEIKKKQKGQKSQTEAMQDIPKVLPALMRGTKIQLRASKVGFDWSDVYGAIAKIKEETDELIDEIKNNDRDNCFEEIGDLLFAVVNVSRFLDIDCEEALTQANNKFIDRFSVVETLSQKMGKSLNTMTLEEMDILWEKAKNDCYSKR